MAISRITPFNAGSDDIDSWTAVLGNTLIAAGVDRTKDGQKERATAILLASIGVPTYSLVKDLVSPKEPEEMEYDELVKTLKQHYKPAPKAISERFKFFNRRQQHGESVTVFLSELRRLATTCKFKDLETSLRDQFACGLQSETAQKLIFCEEDDLKLDKAVKIAISQESAEASTKLVRSGASSQFQTTHQVNSGKDKWRKNEKSGHEKKNDNSLKCKGCGSNKHLVKDCPHKEVQCYKCNGKGHFSKYCKAVSSKKKSCNNVVDKETPAVQVGLKMNGVGVDLELDTGSGKTFISPSIWRKMGSPMLSESTINFQAYSGDAFQAKGKVLCQVEYGQQRVNHEVFVTNEERDCLLGRDLLAKLQLDWNVIKKQLGQVNRVNVKNELESLLQEFSVLFDAPVETVRNFKANLTLKDDATPRFCKARPVPYALRDKVTAELQRMESAGVLTKVEHSEWASPLVVVPKANGKVRITGDFKRTVNSQLCVNQYPLARVDDLMETVAEGKTFSKLDASDAFHQIEVNEVCKKYLVVNTHLGLFRYNVLPQGISSSPAIFQEMMDKMLHGIPRSGSFVDDSITTGKDDSEHLGNLREIFTRMRDWNYRLSKDKCVFLKESINFLGFIVSKRGMQTNPEKVDAILGMKAPTSKAEVSSFLGLVNFYSKFIPHFSTICEPLYNLTKDKVDFVWNAKCQKAFEKVKSAVSSDVILDHYKQDIPIGISCDASSVGCGVVLFNRYPDGTEKPIAFASKTLSPAERNYSQIEKEGLGIIFGLKRFVKYLFGRRFILVTDHAPLLAIFGDKKDVPSLVATRLHRWALFLSGYSFDIEYRSTHSHGNADALSRLPLPYCEEEDEETNVVVKRIVEDNPVTSKKMKLETSRDPTLCKLIRLIQFGWPKHLSQVPDDVKPYFVHRDEFTVEGGIVMWGIRVVVPASLKQIMLSQLHDTHPGTVRMKLLARQFVWWPNIDEDIADTVKTCHSCCSTRDNPPSAPLHPWAYPEQPWQRLHVDLAGPFLGTTWLVLVDAHSKWPEVVNLGHDTTSKKVICVIREMIARFGIPETIVSDNGPQFKSMEFESFCVGNGIRHAKSSVYHPRSNGEAERFVRSFKSGLSHCKASDNLNLALCDYLLTYRITPHATTGVPPSDLMLKRKPKTLLDLVKPDVSRNVRKSQDKMKEVFGHANLREFVMGQAVWVRTFAKDAPTWSLGVIVDKRGPLTYMVEVEGRQMKRHVDQLMDGEPVVRPAATQPPALEEDEEEMVLLQPDEPAPIQPQPQQRYPTRNRQLTDRYIQSLRGRR